MIKLAKKYSFTSSTILRINTTINTMPCLKTVLNDLLYHLMSSLSHADDEVRRNAFALTKRPFANTRYSSHVHFHGKRLWRKLVPSGFLAHELSSRFRCQQWTSNPFDGPDNSFHEANL